MTASCGECGKTEGKLRLCTRCRNVRYCSTECQRKAWLGGHKDACAASSKEQIKSKPIELSEESRKALAELQGKYVNIQSSLQVTNAQILALKKQFGTAKVTETAIEEFAPETRMFESVGRMYLRKDKVTIKRNLNETMESSETKIKKLQDTQEYLTKSLAETEEHMLELKSRG